MTAFRTTTGPIGRRRTLSALAAACTLAVAALGATIARADDAPGGGAGSTTSTSSTTTTSTVAPASTTTTTLAAPGTTTSTTTLEPDPVAAQAATQALDLGANAATANSVTVRKTTHAGDPTGTFTIRLQTCTGSAGLLGPCRTNGSWSDVSTTALGNGDSHEFTGLSAATDKRYRVVEDSASGWVLTSVTGASCGGSSTSPSGTAGGRNFGVWVDAAAQDCTFDNANRRVTITKAADAPGSFTIRLQRCSSNLLLVCTGWTDVTGGPGTWSDGTTFEFASLPDANLGVYRAIETLQEGWRLTDLTCTGGTTIPDLTGLVRSPPYYGSFFFLTGSDPTRSCTFTNEANRITVSKATAPTGAPREFPTRIYRCKVNFLTACVGGNDVTDTNVWEELESFDLEDGTSHDLLHPDATLFDRLYAVVEDDPGSEWTTDVDCTGNLGIGSPVAMTNGQKFTFSAVDLSAATATCAITNSTTTGSITVAKSSTPVGGTGFDFALTDLDDPSGTPSTFTIDDLGSRTFSGLFPSSSGGGYDITETSLPPTWSLDDIDCGAAQTTPVNDGVVVSLAAGAHVFCRFENISSVPAGISIVKTATPDVAQVGDTITYTYRVENTGPISVSGLTVVDSPLGPVTLDRTELHASGTPGATATGTLTRLVTDRDAGQIITNTATARGLVACDPFVQVCASQDEGEITVTAVTATTSASVSVLQVAGASVLASSSSSTGNLASTGSSPSAAILAVGLLGLGALLVGATRGRRRRAGLGT